MTRGRRARHVVALALLVLTTAPAAAQQPATPVSETEAYEIASQLRCVVCQNLSVADSPSEMAAQMRELVRERLRAGEDREQVMQYFVDRYGEWILLAPRRSGFNLLVWVLPVVAVVAGLGIVALVLRRWTRHRPSPADAGPALDPAMRDRIRREIERNDA